MPCCCVQKLRCCSTLSPLSHKCSVRWGKHARFFVFRGRMLTSKRWCAMLDFLRNEKLLLTLWLAGGTRTSVQKEERAANLRGME